MNGFGEGIPGIRVRRNKTIDEITPTFGEAMEATAEEAWRNNPIQAGERAAELTEATYGQQLPMSAADLMLGQPQSLMGFENEYQRPERMSAEEARAKVQESGSKLQIPDDGIPQGALDILLKRERERRITDDILARASGDIGTTLARFTVGLGVSALDPINVASAFVPVIGPTRYSMMLAKASTPLARFGVRARVGALEGAVGAGIVEPLIYAANAQEQADYDLTDSLLNVAFGTALGGGLHSGAGAVGDWRTRRAFDALAPERAAAEAEDAQRAWLAETSRSMGESMRTVDDLTRSLEPKLTPWASAVRFSEQPRPLPSEVAASLRGASQTVAEGLMQSSDPTVRELATTVMRLADEGTSLSRREMASIIGDIEAAGKGLPVEGLADLRRAVEADVLEPARRAAMQTADEMVGTQDSDVRALGRQIKELVERRAPAEEFDARLRDLDRLAETKATPDATRIREYLQARRDEQLSLIGESISALRRMGPEIQQTLARVGRDAERMGLPLPEVAPAIMDVVSPQTREAALRTSVAQMNMGYAADIQGLVMSDPAMRAIPALSDGAQQLARDAAVRQTTPEAVRMADFPASVEADVTSARAPAFDAPDAAERSLAETMQSLESLTAGMDPEIASRIADELAPYDRLIMTAEDISRAVDAAANCVLRKG